MGDFNYTGNIDLFNRPSVKNPDATISTVRSMSFQDDSGKEVLIPTVSDDGRIMSNDEAIKNYYNTGKHLGLFNSPEEATVFAESLHNQQQNYYTGDPVAKTRAWASVNGITPHKATNEEKKLMIGEFLKNKQAIRTPNGL